jgi:hypothetical protein
MPLRLPSVAPRLSVDLEALAGLKRDVTLLPGEAEPRCEAFRILLFEYRTSEYRRFDDRWEELTEEETPLGAFEVLP